MKKLLYISIFVCALFLGGVASAEDKAGMMDEKMKEGMATDKMECPVMGSGGMSGDPMMGGMMKMHMRGMMEKTSMVSSNDGGVIVMMGNKLYKYDKDLNLVKEMELKMDEKFCPMPGMMQKEIKKGTPMGKEDKADVKTGK